MAIMVNHFGLDRMFVYGSGFMPEKKQEQGPQKIKSTIESENVSLSFSQMLSDMMQTAII